MERQSIAAVEGDGDKRGISKLPPDLKQLIFAKLSIQIISGSRTVCKEWNSILCSQSFLSSLPAENPWLLICGQKEDKNWYCMAYCFSTKKWSKISLSFLPNKEVGNISDLFRSAQGLLLFGESPTPQLYVCNPLTRSYGDIKIDVSEKFIHLVKGTNGEPYLVVCPNSEKFSFQVYQYFQDSWRVKYEFARETGSYMLGHAMVECNGVLFWRGQFPPTIVGYNIQDGFINPVTVSPLPLEVVQGQDRYLHSMFAYGSSVIVVEAFHDRPRTYRTGIIIWELFQDKEDKLLWKWKEFARMHPKNLPKYLDTHWWDRHCVCVGDYLCFSSLKGSESVYVFAYNLKEGFWQCLPPCKKYFTRSMMSMMSFEPNLNLYQFFKKLGE